MTRHSEYKVKACQRWGAVDKFLVCASCSCASVASTRPGFTSLLFHFLIKQVRRPEFNNYENFLAYCTRIFLLLRETDKEDHAPIRAQRLTPRAPGAAQGSCTALGRRLPALHTSAVRRTALLPPVIRTYTEEATPHAALCP